MLSSLIESVGFVAAKLSIPDLSIEQVSRPVLGKALPSTFFQYARRFDVPSRRLMFSALRCGLKSGSLLVRTRPDQAGDRFNTMIFWKYVDASTIYLVVRQTHVDFDHSFFSVERADDLVCKQVHNKFDQVLCV